MTVSGAVWEVIGGSLKGGIVVRTGKDRSSPDSGTRLLAGALVRALEHDEALGRIRYELLAGSGPRSGWVSTASQGKDLLRPRNAAAQVKEDLDKSRPIKNQPKQATLGINYSQWQAKGKAGRLNPKVVPKAGCDDCTLLCVECGLPIGDIAYRSDEGSSSLLHGECQAQILLQRASKEEKMRKRRDAELKRARRAEHNIGWKIEHIPRNSFRAPKMGFAPVPHSMYSLTFTEESNAVRISPTTCPAAATNLEYLALALQVRMREGREPLFSLDPKEAVDRAKSLWQVKRFEPAWLAGTSLGEAMFQADVHLKELSMGEYAQPVAGMKSCFDFSEEQVSEFNWNAREWFVVRRAEVQLSEEGALIPQVNMGVEAREQIAGPNGLEDAVITSPDHPLVKYAEEFERNFDLIAERKSVVYHLRELAKASVLAKFLVDNEVLIEDPWFNFDDVTTQDYNLEIPQLWNERHYAEIQVKDGKITDAEQGIGARKHGLYGGIELGLERAQVPGVAPTIRPALLTMATGMITRAPTASGLLASGQEGFSYTGRAPPRAVARGVDLNLDNFNLAEATRTAPGAASPFAIGSSFFQSLDSSAKGFNSQDAALFKHLFNPVLSDRRNEGELFMPPDSSAEYMDKLRDLVADEKAACQMQKDHFLSVEFQKEAPGPLFPSSWVPAITQGQAANAGRELHARLDCSSRMERILKSLTPVFDQAAEDGSKFRIYEVGSLEVRTIQEHDGKEKVGTVLSSLKPRDASVGNTSSIGEDDVIAKATQFVEGDSKRPQPNFRFFVVFETLAGDSILTEMLGDMQVSWMQNPTDLEARTSCAKALRSEDCSNLGITVSEVRTRKDREASHQAHYAPEVECACYADEMYGVVLAA